MTYAVANLHGCYEAFKKLLEKINFGDKDVLFVVGDTVDYGDEPMELLCDMSVRCNVYPVMGSFISSSSFLKPSSVGLPPSAIHAFISFI